METANPFHIAFGATEGMIRRLEPAVRLDMYARARAAMAAAIEAEVDPARVKALRRQARELENGVRAFEADIREKRVSLTAARQPAAPPPRPAAAEGALFPYAGRAAPPARRAGPLGALAARAAGVEALAWRHARLTAAGGPLAYFWIVVEPAIPIFFITALYLLLGRFEVFDMPTPAFVSLGVGAWFVFRAVFVRLSAGHGADAQLLRLPRVTEFDLFASKTLFVVVLYAIMLAALLGGMVAAGWAPPPERPLAVLGLLGCMAVSGFGLGLTYCLLMRRFPPLLKVRMILLRVLYVTSGAMYVTEQLPDFVTDWLKLNPFLHVVQLTRAAWFPLYETTAVSLSVALWATAASLLAGLASLRVLSRAPRSP